MSCRQDVRAARDALNSKSMACVCGGKSTVDAKFTRPSTDGEMRTLTRRRQCTACPAEWKTVELNAAELVSLRTAAAMFFLSIAPRTPA